MSLERYCKDRLVVLKPLASAFEAARAMAANHVGTVLVEDQRRLVGIVTDRDLAMKVVGRNMSPRDAMLYQVMTGAPDTIELDATELEALEMMRDFHVRRLVIMDRGHLAGIITLDDVILSRAAGPEAVRSVVHSQLSMASPAKPQGATRPLHIPSLRDPRQRSRAHREQTMRRFARHLMERLELSDAGDAVDAFEVVARHIMRRLTPAEANDLASQLPMDIRDRLLDVRAGPDRSVTRASIEDEMAWKLGVDARRAAELVRAVGGSMGDFVSAGELDEVRGQLPRELRELIPRAA